MKRILMAAAALTMVAGSAFAATANVPVMVPGAPVPTMQGDQDTAGSYGTLNQTSGLHFGSQNNGLYSTYGSAGGDGGGH